VTESPVKQAPPKKVQLEDNKGFRQQTKDRINELLFRDEIEDDSFIFKDEAESEEDKKRAEIVSPNNLTVGEDPAIDK
jgi:hypothetical protein